MVASRRAWEETMDRWASQYATWAEWRRGEPDDGCEHKEQQWLWERGDSLNGTALTPFH